jgi:uncharacterized protein (TIGR02145 family)
MKKLSIILAALTILMIAGTVIYKHKDNNSLIDTRDGQKYKTVMIGNQLWMAENLNYETANSYCYNNSADSCAKYGRLYTWAAAMDSAGEFSTNGTGCGYLTNCSATAPVQGACPNGWHLPTKSEWLNLYNSVGIKFNKIRDYGEEYIGGSTLLSTTGWYKNSRYGVDGKNSYDFSALPAGFRNRGGLFNDVLIKSFFWTSTEYDNGYAYDAFLSFSDMAGLHHSFHKYSALSVRCIKN